MGEIWNKRSNEFIIMKAEGNKPQYRGGQIEVMTIHNNSFNVIHSWIHPKQPQLLYLY